MQFQSELHLACSFRGIQTAIACNYSRQTMRCPVHLSIGQEHWLPFLGSHLPVKRRIFSTHRSHGLYLALGGSLSGLIAELSGSRDGILSGKGGSMHLKSLEHGLEASVPIVGSSIALALGSAFASKHRSQQFCTVAYFGDGACEEGVFHESLNIASTWNLPILFICENNKYSCNTPINCRQPESSVLRYPIAHRIDCRKIPHAASYECYSDTIKYAVNQSITHPFFLEIDSYRLVEHCGHRVENINPATSTQEYFYYLKQDPVSFLLDSDPSFLASYQSGFDKTCLLINKYATAS